MLRHCSGSSHHQSVAAAPATMVSTTFSLFFPLPKGHWPVSADEATAAAAAFDDDHSSITTSPSSPSSSSSAGSVDCTLSLGTPSSRRAAAEPAEQTRRAAQPAAYPSVSASAVSWDVAADQTYYCCQGNKPAAAAGDAARGAGARAEHDPLLMDRRCANCGTSSTPLWRNGPRGPKSLCNACGIRFKKEERRAAAAAAAAAAMDQSGCSYCPQRAQYGQAGKQAPPVPGAVPYYGEAGAFPCGGGDIADAEAAPFLAWRLNVVPPAAPFAVWPERSSLYQYN